MRASADQVRIAGLDAVDSARGHALDVVSTGADLLAASIDKGATSIEMGIDRVADRAPTILVEVAPRRRARRWRGIVLAVVVLVVGGLVVRRLRARGEGSPDGDDVTEPADMTEPTDMTERRSEPAASETEARFSVVPANGGGWDVAGANDASVVSHHPTQAEGIEAAAALAVGAGGGEVVIHGRDGKPRDTRRISPPDGSS